MMTADEKNFDKRVWYKEPYVWFILFFPFVAVVAGLYTIYLAVDSDDGLVVNDYYKHGMEINLTLGNDKQAADYGLQAQLNFNTEQSSIILTLSSTTDNFNYPEKIIGLFAYKTQAGSDKEVSFQRIADNTYQGALPELRNGAWHFQLTGQDWRLLETVNTPLVEKSLTIVPHYQAS